MFKLNCYVILAIAVAAMFGIDSFLITWSSSMLSAPDSMENAMGIALVAVTLLINANVAFAAYISFKK